MLSHPERIYRVRQVSDAGRFHYANLPRSRAIVGNTKVRLQTRPVAHLSILPDPILSLVRVSVVMPALNEADNLVHVFDRMPREVFEVILVDGNSTDGTVEVAKRLWPNVTVITQNGMEKAMH